MNSARVLYLGTYTKIYIIDHLIKKCQLKYRLWKYWHSPMLHGMVLAIVAVYDIYIECAEGELVSEWKYKLIDFWTFRESLSNQMLKYNPIHREYHGDAQMIVCSQQHRNRHRNQDETEDLESATGRRNRGRPSRDSVKRRKLFSTFFYAKRSRGENSRLLGDLQQLKKYVRAARHSIKHPNNCVVCGGLAYSEHTVCQVYLHFNPTKGAHVGKHCFNDYHDDSYFELARCDHKISTTKKSEWSYPSRVKEIEDERIVDSLNTRE